MRLVIPDSVIRNIESRNKVTVIELEGDGLPNEVCERLRKVGETLQFNGHEIEELIFATGQIMDMKVLKSWLR